MGKNFVAKHEFPIEREVCHTHQKLFFWQTLHKIWWHPLLIKKLNIYWAKSPSPHKFFLDWYNRKRRKCRRHEHTTPVENRAWERSPITITNFRVRKGWLMLLMFKNTGYYQYCLLLFFKIQLFYCAANYEWLITYLFCQYLTSLGLNCHRFLFVLLSL